MILLKWLQLATCLAMLVCWWRVWHWQRRHNEALQHLLRDLSVNDALSSGPISPSANPEPVSAALKSPPSEGLPGDPEDEEFWWAFVRNMWDEDDTPPEDQERTLP